MAKRKILGLSWCWTGCFWAILGLVMGLNQDAFSVIAEVVVSSAEAQAHTVALEYQETSSSVITWPATINAQAQAFPKEPPLASGKTLRGILNIGGLYQGKENASNGFAFVWQRDAGKLYLEGISGRAFASNSPSLVIFSNSPPVRYQTFSNLHLPIQCAQGHCQILADLSVYDYGDLPGAVVALRALWQSKLTVGGKDWQIGIIPTAPPISFNNGFLVLRPWEQRPQSISASDGCLAAFAFPKELFFGGVNYRLNWQSIAFDAEIKPVLQLTETPVELGVLKLSGEDIGRVFLENGKRKVVLEQPDKQIQVPAGSYDRAQVLLAKNGRQATIAPVDAFRTKAFTVSRDSAASLSIGGPLTNSVQITRVGQDLRLNYRLLCGDGREYQLANLNRAKPPKFTVYKGGRAIATGDFEFG